VILSKTLTRRRVLGAGLALAGTLAMARRTHGQGVPRETVRFGIIGVGGRGTGLLTILLQRPESQVSAICDINKAHLDRAIGIVRQAKGNKPAGYSKDEYDYRNMLQRDDIDVVLIATSIKWHGAMAVDAMNAGKHVGSEVPACEDLGQCAAMVAAKEKNGVRYMLLENYLYFRENLAVLEMVRHGLLGDPYFAECGYIHEYKTGQYEADGSLNWRGELMQYTRGNNYPTHSGGPVFKWLGINDGDRLQRVTCYATEPNRSARPYYAKRFGEEKASRLPFKLADMTTCLIGAPRQAWQDEQL
jgi:predicted dehydrogenase